MDKKACIMKAINLAGSLIVENGGETYRVEETLTRMGRAFGLREVESFAVPSGVFVTLTFQDGSLETQVYRARPVGTHLEKVDEVNQISRSAARGELTCEEVLARLEKMKKQSATFSSGIRILASGLAAAGFAVMFGGKTVDFAVAFLTGCVIQCLVAALARMQYSRVLQNLLGGAVCTLIPLIFQALFGAGNLDAIVGGAVMPLVPGLAMTNAVQDTMRGDILSGAAHGLQAILTATLIAAGGVVATRLFWLIQGVLG